MIRTTVDNSLGRDMGGGGGSVVTVKRKNNKLLDRQFKLVNCSVTDGGKGSRRSNYACHTGSETSIKV